MSNEFIRSDNPFTLQFSLIPPQYITRKALTEEIIEDLEKKTPAFRGHFLTGVRGCGKSVLLAEIVGIMSRKDDWIVVDIADPTSNIVSSIAKGLCRDPKLRTLFMDAKLDISVLGIGLSIEKSDYIAADEFDALDMMLKALKKKGKRVLVTIDEVTYNDSIGSFSHALSSYARADYDIYVVMTGLKENIKRIKNDRSLTFLYRAKEHVLEPLNITAIISSYTNTFHIDRESAEEMAWITKGYSFAFQVLGYLYWNARCESDKILIEDLLPEVDQYLAEFSYDKIWEKLPTQERTVLSGIADSEDGSVADIRERLGMDSSKFGVYRERLINRGLINGNEYGKVLMTLPRFGEYAKLRERQKAFS